MRQATRDHEIKSGTGSAEFSRPHLVGFNSPCEAEQSKCSIPRPAAGAISEPGTINGWGSECCPQPRDR